MTLWQKEGQHDKKDFQGIPAARLQLKPPSPLRDSLSPSPLGLATCGCRSLHYLPGSTDKTLSPLPPGHPSSLLVRVRTVFHSLRFCMLRKTTKPAGANSSSPPPPPPQEVCRPPLTRMAEPSRKQPGARWSTSKAPL